MTSLETLLNKLDHAEKTSKLDPNEPQYAKTRSGIESAVVKAKESVGKLREEYAQAILNNGVAIFLSGPKDKTEQFCQVVTELGEAVVVNAEELYSRLAAPLGSMIGPSRNFSTEAASHLVRSIVEVAREVGASITRPIRTHVPEVVNTQEEMVSHVRSMIRAEVGDSLAAAYIKKTVGREGLKIRYMGSTSPVIVLNASTEESVGLGQIFGKGKASINLTEEDTIDKEFITKSFKSVSKQLKSQK